MRSLNDDTWMSTLSGACKQARSAPTMNHRRAWMKHEREIRTHEYSTADCWVLSDSLLYICNLKIWFIALILVTINSDGQCRQWRCVSDISSTIMLISDKRISTINTHNCEMYTSCVSCSKFDKVSHKSFGLHVNFSHLTHDPCVQFLQKCEITTYPELSPARCRAFIWMWSALKCALCRTALKTKSVTRLSRVCTVIIVNAHIPYYIIRVCGEFTVSREKWNDVIVIAIDFNVEYMWPRL